MFSLTDARYRFQYSNRLHLVFDILDEEYLVIVSSLYILINRALHPPFSLLPPNQPDIT